MARARNKNEVTEATAAAEAAELDAIEAALNGEIADLEVEDSRFSEEPEVVSADAEDITVDIEVDDTELTVALEADEALSAAYEEQESTVEMVNEDEVAAAAAKASKTVKKASGSKKIDVTTDATLFANAVLDAFKSKGEEITLDAEEGPVDTDSFTTRLKAVSQKKVREKILNMIDAALEGKAPSVYTKIAAKLLSEAATKGESVTIAQIKKAYEDAGYKAGTVAAQSGQMMSLFPTLGLAKTGPVKGVLEPNPNSVLLDLVASAA
ncbi:MAG: hypothetical protein LPK02_07225 [Rhodobacterales bacterium]|nr:hypothetical protein [Rhodobacterales bacterium]